MKTDPGGPKLSPYRANVRQKFLHLTKTQHPQTISCQTEDRRQLSSVCIPAHASIHVEDEVEQVVGCWRRTAIKNQNRPTDGRTWTIVREGLCGDGLCPSAAVPALDKRVFFHAVDMFDFILQWVFMCFSQRSSATCWTCSLT